MLEMNENKGREFAQKLGALQVETTDKIADICKEYGVDLFETIKIFGLHLYQIGADLQAGFKAKQQNTNEERTNE